MAGFTRLRRQGSNSATNSSRVGARAGCSLAYGMRTDTTWDIKAAYTIHKHCRMSAKSPARLSSAASPSSSQTRLPSPPPLPELQLGPQSPSINAPSAEIRLDNTAAQDEGAARRVRPGTTAVDMAKGPPFVPLHQVRRYSLPRGSC